MSKKTIAMVVVILLALCVAGWLFFANNDKPQELPITDVISVEDMTSGISVEESTDFPEIDFDEPSDETRIILVEPENGELTDLLSEKVIRNDKIVDKSPTEQ